MTTKDFRAKIKLYFSSLFARKMTILLIGIPGTLDNEAIFTNITPEQAALYRPDTDYFVHKVTFLDDEFVSALNQYFPHIMRAIVAIDLPRFLSVINKYPKADMSAFGVTITDQIIMLSYSDEDTDVMVPCGVLLSVAAAMDYESIIRDGCLGDTPRAQIDIGTLAADIVGGHHLIPKPDDCGPGNFLYIDGKTSVSAKEFVSKQAGDYEWHIAYNTGVRMTRALYRYRSDKICVFSQQPSMFWYH